MYSQERTGRFKYIKFVKFCTTLPSNSVKSLVEHVHEIMNPGLFFTVKKCENNFEKQIRLTTISIIIYYFYSTNPPRRLNRQWPRDLLVK